MTREPKDDQFKGNYAYIIFTDGMGNPRLRAYKGFDMSFRDYDMGVELDNSAICNSVLRKAMTEAREKAETDAVNKNRFWSGFFKCLTFFLAAIAFVLALKANGWIGG